jgi:hypothetical protein
MIYLLENKIPQLKKASFLLVFSLMFAGMGCKSDKNSAAGALCGCFSELNELREKVKAVNGEFEKIGMTPADGEKALNKFNECMNKAIVKYKVTDDKGVFDVKVMDEIKNSCPDLYTSLNTGKK